MVEAISVQTECGTVTRLWIDRKRGFHWTLRCPGCGGRGTLDEDQVHGRVSVDCDGCSFHETFDFAGAVASAARDLAREADPHA
jgi:hypothetical protein